MAALKVVALVAVAVALSACTSIDADQVTVIVDQLPVYSCSDLSCDVVGAVSIGERPYIAGDDVNGFTPIQYFLGVYYVESAGVEK
jgi:hypothetical protein